MSDSRTRSRADRRRAKEEPPADKRPLAPDLKVVETQVVVSEASDRADMSTQWIAPVGARISSSTLWSTVGQRSAAV